MSAVEGHRWFVSWRDLAASGIRTVAPSTLLHAGQTPFPALQILEEAEAR